MRDEDLYPMIRGHEITLQLAKTPGLAQLLSDLGADPQLRRSLRENPRGLLSDRNMDLPGASDATMELELRELHGEGWELEVRVTEGLYTYINGFNNEKGFYRVQGPQRPRRKDEPPKG
jgi:hypothetical protein